MRPRARELAATLGLEPHPEGGFFRESYRADETLATPRGERPLSTAIVFLVTADAISHMHRLTSDELWVFQGGLPLELVTIAEDGQLIRRVLGEFEEGGDEELLPQALVPAGSWQGARLAGGPHPPADHAWALVSCIVTPGFSYEDFELGEQAALLAEHPQHAEIIRDFT
jgi:uncharacterized protein